MRVREVLQVQLKAFKPVKTETEISVKSTSSQLRANLPVTFNLSLSGISPVF